MRPDRWALAAPEFVAIFPNGDQLLDTFVLLNTIDWANPRTDIDLRQLATEHLSAREASPCTLRYVPTSPAPDLTPLNDYLKSREAQWNAVAPWFLSNQHGRRQAALTAGDALKAAAAQALHRAADMVPEVLLKSLSDKFQGIASDAAWHIILTDLVSFENASLPLLKMLQGGVVPIGVGREGSFDVIAIGEE